MSFDPSVSLTHSHEQITVWHIQKKLVLKPNVEVVMNIELFTYISDAFVIFGLRLDQES